MMPFEDQNIFANRILDDIQRCLEKSRLDEQMLYFIHIYNLLDKQLQDNETVKDVFVEVKKKYTDIGFMKTLDFYYALSTGEEARLLFDPTIDYNPKYDLENFDDTYKTINSFKLRISECLGLIKNKLFVVETADFTKGWTK